MGWHDARSDEGVSEDLLKQSFKIYALTLDKLMQLDLQ